jgi:hypothetical protein
MSAKRKLRMHTTSCAAGSIDLQDMSRLVDAAASLTSADESTLQGVLAQLSVPERYPPLGAAVLFLFFLYCLGGIWRVVCARPFPVALLLLYVALAWAELLSVSLTRLMLCPWLQSPSSSDPVITAECRMASGVESLHAHLRCVIPAHTLRLTTTGPGPSCCFSRKKLSCASCRRTFENRYRASFLYDKGNPSLSDVNLGQW